MTPPPTWDTGSRQRQLDFERVGAGNPKGRPSGEENILAVFKRMVTKRVRIKEGDKWRTISMADAIILRNCNAALQNDQIAMSNVIRLAEQSGELIDRTDVKQVGRPALFPKPAKDMREFLATFGRTPETE
jgi:hypothetical protein